MLIFQTHKNIHVRNETLEGLRKKNLSNQRSNKNKILSCTHFTLPPFGKAHSPFVGLAYYKGKDIVLGFIIEYSSLRDLGP
jgi:hypothetical protein